MTRALAGLAALVLVAGCRQPEAPPTEPAPPALASGLAQRLQTAGLAATTLDVERVDSLEVYALAEAETKAGSFLVQWADLRHVAVEQVLGDTTRQAATSGAFVPGSASPFFAMLAPDSVVSASAGSGLLLVMNGAFFETPGEPSTQLAFPLAVDGEIVTGGSSPNGPGQAGTLRRRLNRRWDRPLRALALGGLAAQIVDVDTASGEPLGRGDFRDAMASYAPEAHPTRRATRFHLMGALDRDENGAAEMLVIVTNDGRSTIDDTGAVLDTLGVAPEARIAPDGGASVFVWNRARGVLHRPAGGQSLPHYLTLRLR